MKLQLNVGMIVLGQNSSISSPVQDYLQSGQQ